VAKELACHSPGSATEAARWPTATARPGLPRGLIFVLRGGIPWRMLPKKLGCGSGMTCWLRLRDWQQDGVWELIHFVLLNWLSREGQIDWSHAVLDSCSLRAVFGGPKRDSGQTRILL
jgi:transposase